MFEKIENVKKALNATKCRSAWDIGVNEYAREILDGIEERANHEGREPESFAEFRAWALNGAEDSGKRGDTFAAWSVASWGGSYLIYDGDIAERLCTPSELKKTKGGDRRPNAREEWLDVQARALYQAFNRISRIYKYGF